MEITKKTQLKFDIKVGPQTSQNRSLRYFLLFYARFRSRKNFRYYLCNRNFFHLNLSQKISNFSKTVHKIFIKFGTVTLHPNVLPCAQWLEHRLGSEKNFWNFSIFSKSLVTIRTKFSAVILHHYRVQYVQGHQKHMAAI